MKGLSAENENEAVINSENLYIKDSENKKFIDLKTVEGNTTKIKIIDFIKDINPINAVYADKLLYNDNLGIAKVVQVNDFITIERMLYNNYRNMTKKNINIENIVFVGNSLIEGLKLYSNSSNTFLSKVGINLDGLKSNIYSQLESFSCDTVVIGMGTNDLGYYSEEKFKSSYMDLINKIYSINPSSVIICMSIPPVSQGKSDNDKQFNNDNVEIYNQYIKNICEENNLIYLDNTKYFGDCLNNNWTSDGIHLRGNIYKEWYDYIIEEIKSL